MMDIIPALSVAAVPVLGSLIWWLLRGRMARDQGEHAEMRAAIGKMSDALVAQAGRSVSSDDCRVCHSSTLHSIQAVQVRLSTLQDSIADVRENVAIGIGQMSGKLDTLTRLVASKTEVGKHD